MTNKESIENLIKIRKIIEGENEYCGLLCFDEMIESIEMSIKALENQDRGVVSLSTYEQVRWERDIAISQLEELGYGFGEKIRDEDKKSGEIIDIDMYLELVKREIITDEDGHGYYIDAHKCSTRASDFEPEQIEAMKNLGARYVCWSRNE